MTIDKAFQRFKKIDSNSIQADSALQYMKLLDEIFDYYDKKNSCAGCKYDEKDDAYPTICWECSRYYDDKFEKG